MRQEAAASREWEVDAVPIMARFEDGRSPRPVLMLVVAGAAILHHDLLGHLRGETADVAAALEGAVVAAAREAGVFPERVRVRHEDMAGVLADRLATRDIAVSGGGVPRLDDVAREMVDALVGAAMWPPVCRPDTWSAWDVPRALVTGLFAASASFYRMAPWQSMSNLQAPRATLPSGREWTCCVMGNAGQEYGLILYSQPSDLFEVTADPDPVEPFNGVQGRMLSLTFERGADAPDIHREARTNRWEVAGPAAIPVLTTVNTPGGGVTQEDIRDITAILSAIPAFAAKHGRALMREEDTGKPVKSLRWVAESGITFQYAGEAAHFSRDIGTDEALFELPHAISEEFGDIVRRTFEELDPGTSEADMLDAVNRALMNAAGAYNDAAQSDFGGLSPSQMQRLLAPEWDTTASPIRFRKDLPFAELSGSTILSNARTLLGFAIEHGPLGATQAGNLKVDIVATLAERLILPEHYLESHRTFSKRLVEQDVWPLHQLRVVCELAGLLHHRSTRFEITTAGRALMEPGRAGELFALLFHTWFRTFSIEYGSRWEWPGLQSQMAFTLYRLCTEAVDWTDTDDVLRRAILPEVLRHMPVTGDLDNWAAEVVLRLQVLHPLAGFGLLDEREPSYADLRSTSYAYRITPLATAFMTFHL